MVLLRHFFLLLPFVALCFPQLRAGEPVACSIGAEEPTSVLVPHEPDARLRGADPPPPGPPLREPDMQWVEDTLASMTLAEKVGQMIMPQWSSGSAANHVSNYGVGGFVFLANSSSNIRDATNSLQAASPVPLLFSIDCEAGAGARVTDGTRFPMNMGLAATRSTEFARAQGRVTARECRTLGIHIGFGPVVDVNIEPINPIIGIRAYGDDPAMIARLAEAYIEGANEEGLLCTLKHFPGHGATVGDSHENIQTVNISCEELQDVHVRPYGDLIAGGFRDLVMSAHVWYPCLDPGPDAWPATISSAAMTGILRDQLGFEGVLVSDAFNMAGLTAVSGNYEAARIGVQAGLDVILMPSNVADAYNGILDAVNGGQIGESRIDASVRRILILKSRAGLPENLFVTEEMATQTLRHPEHIALSNEIGSRAVSAALVNPALFPVTSQDRVLVLAIAQSSQIFYVEPRTHFTDEIQRLLPQADIQMVTSNPGSTERNAIITSLTNYDRVIVATYDWRPTLIANKMTLINGVLSSGKPTAYVSFGSPYHINLFPGLVNYLCGFSSNPGSQVAAARLLAGEAIIGGQWPVELGREFGRQHLLLR